MTALEVTIDRAPVGEHWLLGPLPPPIGRLALLAWDTVPPAVDAGMPEVLAPILAQVLTEHGWVVFPVEAETSGATDGWLALATGDRQLVSASSLLSRSWRRLTPQARPLAWCASPRAERVRALFDDAAFPWWGQGQLALVFPEPESLPGAESIADASSGLFSEAWVKHASDLGADLALRPGVDGAVAGMWARREETLEACLQTLAGVCRSLRPLICVRG